VIQTFSSLLGCGYAALRFFALLRLIFFPDPKSKIQNPK
jgi:hypothetical protein